jgi:hypothetical protein
MPRPIFLMKDACIIALIVIHFRATRASPPLLEPLVTAASLPAPALQSYRPLPPHAPEPVDGDSVFTLFQTMRTSLLRLEASLFAPPCNSTGPLAASCNGTDAPPAPHRADWLGRHHFGLRRQILSYDPPATTPPLGWQDATPGPDGFYDSAPDPDLPSPSAIAYRH